MVMKGGMRGKILDTLREMESKRSEYWRLNRILKEVLKDSKFWAEELGG